MLGFGYFTIGMKMEPHTRSHLTGGRIVRLSGCLKQLVRVKSLQNKGSDIRDLGFQSWFVCH